MKLFYADQKTILAQMPNERFRSIAKQVLEGERINVEDGLYLLQYPDEEPLRLLADLRRQLISGNTVYYASTIYVHPTNLCELSCPMCSYYAKPGWKSAWFLPPRQAFDKILPYLEQGASEVHVVGGLWKETDLSYYRELFAYIKDFDDNIHIKALTPVEYDFLSQIHAKSVREVLELMKMYGLGSLPGGGAEILHEEIRKQVAPQKIDSQRFLQIHDIAHRLKIPTNITMLYGHVEDPFHIIYHLNQVREQQDKSGGFQTFIPLKYHEENNALGKRKKRLKPKDPFRIYAISRLLLDNVRNIKVLWNYIGASAAQQALYWGVNDLGSTAFEEKIIRMAGGTELIMNEQGIEELAKSANRPVKRINSGYNYALDSKEERAELAVMR